MSASFTFFVDESGEERKADYMTLGGVIASCSDWMRISTQWSDVLRGYNVPYYHASDCNCSQSGSPYDGWSIAKRNAFVYDLITVLLNSRSAFLAATVERKAYQALPPKHQELLGGQYGLGFQFSLDRLKDLPPELALSDGKISIIFEERRDYVGEAFARYDAMKQQGEWSSRLVSCAKAGKLDFIPLQCADLFVYWTNKVQCERERVNASDRLFVRPEFARLSDSERAKVTVFDGPGLARRIAQVLKD